MLVVYIFFSVIVLWLRHRWVRVDSLSEALLLCVLMLETGNEALQRIDGALARLDVRASPVEYELSGSLERLQLMSIKC